MSQNFKKSKNKNHIFHSVKNLKTSHRDLFKNHHLRIFKFKVDLAKKSRNKRKRPHS